jgi:hypothetical protein
MGGGGMGVGRDMFGRSVFRGPGGVNVVVGSGTSPTSMLLQVLIGAVDRWVSSSLPAASLLPPCTYSGCLEMHWSSHEMHWSSHPLTPSSLCTNETHEQASRQRQAQTSAQTESAAAGEAEARLRRYHLMVPCRLGDVLTGCSKTVAGPPGTQETFDLQVVTRLPVPACASLCLPVPPCACTCLSVPAYACLQRAPLRERANGPLSTRLMPCS